MSKNAEAVLRDFCVDHLVMNAKIDRDSLLNQTAYDLFLQVYDTVEVHLDEKIQAREANDFDRFRAADEKLWKNGFAVMAFALAEKLGWMRELKPVPINK